LNNTVSTIKVIYLTYAIEGKEYTKLPVFIRVNPNLVNYHKGILKNQPNGLIYLVVYSFEVILMNKLGKNYLHKV